MDRSKAQPVLIGMGVEILYSSFGGAWAVIQTDMLQFVFLGVLLPVALLIGLNAVSPPAALASAATTGRGEAQAPYDPMQDYVETLQWWHVHPDWGASLSEPSCRVEP